MSAVIVLIKFDFSTLLKFGAAETLAYKKLCSTAKNLIKYNWVGKCHEQSTLLA